ncbi:MAG: 23S rRNA (uracil(1939)-C(5))-methyltransferase RlmD [Acidobacteriota bacterium]|nr:23S rRNA (uracil(1939)-C(5))-methyltransferase RlmD [Acidobacteriota bacterium]
MVGSVMEPTHSTITCPHGRECGACTLLGVDYSNQLTQKRGVLKKAIGKLDSLRDVSTLPCLPSPLIDRYRNRAKMAVGMSQRGGNRLGYFRSQTREIVDAPDCRVLVPELLETTRRIRKFLAIARGVPRSLRHIDVRCGTDPGRQHLTLVFRTKELPNFPLDGLRKQCPSIDGISVNLNPSKGPQVIRGSVKPLWGEREIWVDHADLRLRVSPAAFFQVNLALLPEIHRLMETFFGGGKMLADLYSGVGTHGLALRKGFEEVFFAEGNRSAIADLKATMRARKLGDYRVSAVSVERGLAKLKDAAPDAVVLNPSRAGAEESVLETIARCPTKKIAYLSCDPDTLCRDLEILRRKKFTIQSVQPIDMMPQTRQVEALALLTRA